MYVTFPMVGHRCRDLMAVRRRAAETTARKAGISTTRGDERRRSAERTGNQRSSLMRERAALR
jgi:hypothetical protein